MTDAERRYLAAGAAGYYAERIQRQAETHHVSRRMEAIACLVAAIDTLDAEIQCSLSLIEFVGDVTKDHMADLRARERLPESGVSR